MKVTYTAGCYRNVRGACGHRHQSISLAVACIEHDRAACKRAGGFSDRIAVYGSDGSVYGTETVELANGRLMLIAVNDDGEQVV